MSPKAVRLVLVALILACAGLVFAQAGGLLGGAAEPSALSRIFPLRAETAGGGDPWRLFDGDTGRGFAGSKEGVSRVRLLLDGEQALTAVGVFGPADGRLTVWAEEGGVPSLLFEMEPRAAGWQRIPVPGPVATRALLVDWQPASPGAVLPEIELWSARQTEAGERSARGLPAAVQVKGGSPAVLVRLGGDPATAERAFLSYELTGLSHWSQAVRSINGHPFQGFGAQPAQGALQTEEIDPRWLRRGMNEILFTPANAEVLPESPSGEAGRARSFGAEVVPYEVRNLRLVLTGDSGRTSSARPWKGARPLELRFARPSQPYALEISVADGTRGVLTATARLAGGGAVALLDAVDLGGLQPGRHFLPLREGVPAASTVELAWSGERSGEVSAAAVLASPVGARRGPRLEITHPPAGDPAELGAYLRGFVQGPAGVPGVPSLRVNGALVPGAVTAAGALGVLIPRPEGEEGAWDLHLDLTWPDGSRLTRVLRLGQSADDPDGEGGDGHEVEREVGPGVAKTLTLDGARLEVPKGAVDRKVKLTLRALATGELPALDAGMTNVTPGRGGFRFGPHGQKFKKPLAITLPYDPELIPEGLRVDDVRTYFFDEEAGRWIALNRLKTSGTEVVSTTDHFTDFINATLTLPDQPASASFNPNSMQDLAKADPAAEIILLKAPEGEPGGDASLDYPLVIPKGRRGLQPDLSVTYGSGGGNGWLGIGWDLTLPSIDISTLFGVPRYDPSFETETYMLQGEQLAPVAQPGSPRQADRVFTRRIEGSFDRVVRHGSGPADFWWEVTDKKGIRSIYGQSAQARLADPGSGNTSRWLLEQVIDLHGNTVDYSYAHDSGSDGEPWVQAYPAAIRYTGVNGSGGFYQVLFQMDDGEQRPDRFTSGLSGFKTLTRRRLAQVDVLAGDDLVRRYVFSYREGDFRKSVLASLAVTGEDGTTELARHDFEYQQATAAFGPMQTWGGIGSGKDCNASFNVGGGVHVYAGLGPPPGSPVSPTCTPLVGIQVGGGVSGTTELANFLDVNGDGLPDRVDDQGTVDLNRRGSFQSTSVSGVSDIGRTLEFTFDVSGGVRIPPLNLGATFVYSHSNDDRAFMDINGDGFPDLVGADGGFRTRLNNGTSFLPASNWGGFGASGLTLGRPGEEEEVLSNLKLSDTLRRLVLPFAGPVALDGAIQKKQAGGDGVRVQIFHNDTRIWQRTFAASDMASCVPADGDSCGAGLTLNVQAGDRLYFLANSIRETSADALLWAPRVTYTGQDEEALEPWGSRVYRFDGEEDFRLAGPPGSSFLATGNGTAQIQGAFVKQTTSDGVTVQVIKNGDADNPLYERTFTADETGSFDQIPSLPVSQGDSLSLQVSSETPVDPDHVRWTPQVTLDGDQPEQLQQPQKAQVYYAIPKLDPANQPTMSWTVPAGWDGNLHLEWTAGTGDAILYVQGLHRLYDRRTVSGSTSFDVMVDADEGDAVFVTVLGSGTLAATANGETVPVNERTLAEATTEAMSGGWHGWFYGEWNGNESFHEAGLDLPQSEDAGTPDFLFGLTHWEGTTGVSQPVWTAGGFDLYMAAEGVKPSRQGGNAAGDLEMASGTSGGGGGLSILRKTTGRTGAANIGLGLSLSLSFGDSLSEVDLLDMNGDRYADQVSGSGVRFSDGQSGFGGLASFSGLDSAVRRSDNGNVSASIGLGTLFVGTGGSGKVERVRSTLPTIGTTVSLSQTRYDLIDVNGDGLPDRVSMDSGAPFVTVRLNLGYRFGAPEAWPLPGWADSDFDSGVGGCLDAVSGLGASLGQAFVTVASPNAISFTRSSAFTAGIAFGPLGGGGSTTLARTLVQMVDVNGDGLADHVAKEQDEDFFRVKLNRGDYWEAEQHWPVPGWGTGLGEGYVIPGVMRCIDAISYNGDIAANVSLGFAGCFTIIPPVPVLGLQFEITGQIDGSGGGLQLTFQDLDGDGLPDHVLKKRDDPNVYVKLNQSQKANLLTAVHRPLGGSFSLTYERQGNKVGLSADGQRKVDMPSTQWVLASVTENDGRGSSYTTRYDYFDESYQDRIEREPYGFARVKTTRPDGSTIDRRYSNQSFYQRRLLEREETADASGRVFRVETCSYDLRASSSHSAFPAKVQEETLFFEGTGSAGKSTAQTWDYDSFGNAIAYRDSGDQGTDDDAVATAAYHVDPLTYVVQPSRLEVRDGAGRLLRERRGTYNAQGDLVRLEQVLAGGKDPATGSSYSGTNNAVWTLGYDGVGNLASAVDAAGFTSTFTWDPVAQTWPVQVSDSFGYTSRFAWNLKHGRIAETIDKNNQSIRHTYDGFGRLVRVVGPYDTDASPTLAFEYNPAASPAWSVVHHRDAVRSDPINSVVFIDGLGRTLQTKDDAELDLGNGTSTRTGMRVSGLIEFDALSRVAVEGQPVFDTGATTAFVNVPLLNPTRYTYDVLDRTTEARFPHGAVTRMDYGFATLDSVSRLSHTRTDPNGRATVFYDHVRGNVLGVRQTNTLGGSQRTLISRYAYDAMSQLTAATDPEGSVTRLEYDTLGRNIILDNPDAGRTESRFTPAGDLGAKITASLAAQGQQIRYLRTFHRLDRVDYPVTPDAVFTYGGPGAPENRADRIATVSNESGLEERSYGRLGEVVRSVRTATALSGASPRGPYTTTFQYDSFERLLSMVYPDGEQVTWGYDAGGQVKTASGLQAGATFEYLRHQGYDEFGQKVRTLYGNGAESRWTYDPRSRELAALQSQENGGRKIQDLAYRRDLTGTLLGLDNNLPPGRSKELGGPSTQTFAYDDLYQLVGAQGTWRTAPNKVSSYTLALSYDEAGDLVAKNQLHEVASGGNAQPQLKTTYNWAYAYGGAQPHAPTQIGTRTFHYDLNGNQTGWESGTNGARRINTWDEENRLKSVDDNGQTTRFLYDNSGARANKQGQNNEVIYVNRWYSVANGAKTTKHVFADDVRLSSKVGSTSPKVFFYQPDHLGSTHFVTDDLGKAWQHLEYFPGGEVWVDERSATEGTPYLFSGKEVDEETGLADFGFRYYDSRQGQWISTDPLLDGMLDTARIAKPQTTHKPFRLPGHVYGYAANSPTNQTDALGLEEADPETVSPPEQAAAPAPAPQTEEPAQQASTPAQQPAPAAEEKPYWPPNRGFEGDPSETTLQPGTLIDRYGGFMKDGQFQDKGTFVAPEDTPFEQRALPQETAQKTYSVYEVLKPIPGVQGGLIAPWFGQPGMGTQYDLPQSINSLVEGGFLGLVSRTPGK
ncbi:MAG TPA: glycohydrolase toxin TNT-related protein [Thermoanaerobaculia bacterium]|nr:glycohydrolase toxin TNT-related protein [Thermoanaerobaculia bacterium]